MYGIDFTSKASMGWDIAVNWFNWPINQLGKTCEVFLISVNDAHDVYLSLLLYAELVLLIKSLWTAM